MEKRQSTVPKNLPRADSKLIIRGICVLIEYSDFFFIKNNCYKTTQMHTFFPEVYIFQITHYYIQELGMHDKI